MQIFRFLTFLAIALLALVEPALAESGGEARGDWSAIAAGFGIAIAVFGGALSQAKIGAAALEGIGRNPGAAGQMFTPMIVGLALVESLVIYALVIAFQLL